LTGPQAGGQVALHLGAVVATAEVRVNGRMAGIRVAPPWTFDLTGLVKPGDNQIEILVYNTLANHYLTVPTRYGGKPTSGLLGPVTIQLAESAVTRIGHEEGATSARQKAAGTKSEKTSPRVAAG
jgi:hypothetical protein